MTREEAKTFLNRYDRGLCTPSEIHAVCVSISIAILRVLADKPEGEVLFALSGTPGCNPAFTPANESGP